MFMLSGLSDRGLLSSEIITKDRHLIHINWWANKLQALLPERMNLVLKAVGPVLGGCRNGRGNGRSKEEE